MSNLSKLSKEIPSTELDFMVEVEGDVTKKRFVGEFTCKIPNKKTQCFIDKHRAFLNGPMQDSLSPDTLRFHHMVSYLRYTITDSPKWWKENDLGYEMYDENVIKEVYEKVLDFEEKWLTQVWGEEAIAKLKAKGDKKEDEKKDGEEAEKEAE